MDHSEVPFIAEFEPGQPTHPPKQYRPLSTRPWVLLLYLAATVLCFGGLLTVSLIEKETNLHTKRGLEGLQNHEALLPRQVTSSSARPQVTTSAPGATTAILSLASATPTRTTTAILSLASSTTQVTSSICTSTFSVTIIAYSTLGGGTSVTGIGFPTTSGTCASVYITITKNSILSLTAPSTSISSVVSHPSSTNVLSLTSKCQVTVTATSIVYIGSGTATMKTQTSQAPAAPVSGSCNSVTVTIITTSLLSLTSQPKPSSTVVSSQVVTTASPVSQLSLTSQCQVTVTVQNTDSPPSGAAALQTQSALWCPVTVTAYNTNTIHGTSSLSSFATPSTSSATFQLSLTSGYLALTSQSSRLTSQSSVISSSSLGTTVVISAITTSGSKSVSTTSITWGVTSMLALTSKGSSSVSSALQTILTTTVSGTNVVWAASTTYSASSFPSSTSLLALTSKASQSGFTTQSPTPYTFTTARTTMILTSTTTVTASSSTGRISASTKPASDRNSTVDPALNADLVLIKMPFHNYEYFLALYLPKFVAVVMSSVWSIIFAGLKLMEPFYYLSARSGASAKDTMFGSYLSSELSPSSIPPMFRGQWVLLLGSMVLLGWAAVVALVSESMVIISKSDCVNPNNGSHFRCDPGWAVNRPVLNILLALLGLIFVLIFILTCIILRRRRSGVFTDPSSIASMAELLGHPGVMQDIQQIDATASQKEARTLLGENRYKLGYYDARTGKSLDFESVEFGEQRWGLIKLAEDPMSRTLIGVDSARAEALLSPDTVRRGGADANKKRRVLQVIYDTIMLLTALCIFGLVLGYYLDYKSDPLNDFFNNNSFGPRIVLTTLALIVSTGWRRTSQQFTLLAPYRSMARACQSQSGVPARRSILATVACTPYTALHKGFVLRNYLVTTVAMSAVLSDVLLIAISGVPFSSGQIKPSLQASTFVSLAILGLMAITSVAVIIHNRTSAGGTRRLPRSPDTLIGVWLYLAGSGLTEHEKFEYDKQIPHPLERRGLVAKYDGGQYAFARAIGIDGVCRWTVDEAAELRPAKLENLQQPPLHHDPNWFSRPSSQLARGNPEARETPTEAASYEQFRQQQLHQPPSVQRKPVPRPPSAYWQQQENRHRSPQHNHLPRTATQRFEAQAKSPVEQSTQQRFEPLRPRDQVSAPSTTDTQHQYSAPEQERQMQENDRFVYKPPTMSVRTRSNGIWSGPNQYTRYGTGNAN